jgi:cephalosporin-C deacetylase
MPWYDLPEAELRSYRTSTPEPDGLDAWWRQRLDEAGRLASDVLLSRHEPDTYGPVQVYDVEFSGARGDRIRGWFLRPASPDPVPVVVTYIGYGGGRGVPVEHLALPAVGLAAFVMDTRGQGGKWTIGATGDPGRASDGPEYPGVMTRGISRPESYYYTRLMTDAALAVEVAASFDGVDASRVGVAGTSQGGGLALAAAALRPDLVRACASDVPFLCDFARAISLSSKYPYREIADFFAQHVDLVPVAMDTLRYVDVALLARRIRADCLVSVGLMDEICPPSTVFATFNEIPSAKEIAVYPFGVHDVPNLHLERRLLFLRKRLLASE